MKKIAILSQKGGAGKTTLAVPAILILAIQLLLSGISSSSPWSMKVSR